jgi:hypothetical protein
MIRISFDVSDLAVTQGDADAAATRTHVTGRVLDLATADLCVIVLNGIQHALTFWSVTCDGSFYEKQLTF